MAMQRRPDLYPPVSDSFADAAIFSPDRWEKWTPKPWQYVPFNGGPRCCRRKLLPLPEMAFTSEDFFPTSSGMGDDANSEA